MDTVDPSINPLCEELEHIINDMAQLNCIKCTNYKINDIPMETLKNTDNHLKKLLSNYKFIYDTCPDTKYMFNKQSLNQLKSIYTCLSQVHKDIIQVYVRNLNMYNYEQSCMHVIDYELPDSTNNTKYFNSYESYMGLYMAFYLIEVLYNQCQTEEIRDIISEIIDNLYTKNKYIRMYRDHIINNSPKIITNINFLPNKYDISILLYDVMKTIENYNKILPSNILENIFTVVKPQFADTFKKLIDYVYGQKTESEHAKKKGLIGLGEDTSDNIVYQGKMYMFEQERLTYLMEQFSSDFKTLTELRRNIVYTLECILKLRKAIHNMCVSIEEYNINNIYIIFLHVLGTLLFTSKVELLFNLHAKYEVLHNNKVYMKKLKNKANIYSLVDKYIKNEFIRKYMFYSLVKVPDEAYAYIVKNNNSAIMISLLLLHIESLL